MLTTLPKAPNLLREAQKALTRSCPAEAHPERFSHLKAHHPKVRPIPLHLVFERLHARWPSARLPPWHLQCVLLQLPLLPS